MRNTPARLNDTTNRPNPARDTDFCEEKGVSQHETWPDDKKTVRDTQFNAKKGVSRQGKVVGKRTATGESGCREADLARVEDRGKQRAEVNRQGVSAELCQGVRLDQFTCLIGYSIQYESMTGSSFISYGTNIESPSHQDFRSSVINPS